ncbi:quinoprotein glucose dehydrogenase [Alloyangia pacifica]|uniref:Quinoprotein glucose dehydrogenase n=1 Tax=Alloyangia pacifica TaxID=311180 RepID=A0A1I6RRH9_9RHOB|nr:quinoprotein glucose dehydrogenase [Alloyangia pacifica]SFS67341.1 quinoprotein glucose dehydrogenase [Alloyangia pacifica]
MVNAPSPGQRVGWGVKLLGWTCVLFGLLLFSGGAWLIALGGSWYYGLAGLGLFASGVLLNRGRMTGLWLYLIVWGGTMAWAWWESGSDWWAQVPRMLSPTIILLLMLTCIPALSRAERARG